MAASSCEVLIEAAAPRCGPEAAPRRRRGCGGGSKRQQRRQQKGKQPHEEEEEEEKERGGGGGGGKRKEGEEETGTAAVSARRWRRRRRPRGVDLAPVVSTWRPPGSHWHLSPASEATFTEFFLSPPPPINGSTFYRVLFPSLRVNWLHLRTCDLALAFGSASTEFYWVWAVFLLIPNVSLGVSSNFIQILRCSYWALTKLYQLFSLGANQRLSSVGFQFYLIGFWSYLAGC